MHKLILLRHGESGWNRENRFTGWTDVDLSPAGIEEAHRDRRGLLGRGFTLDVARTSVLKRAIRTIWIVLDEMELMWIPVHRSWRAQRAPLRCFAGAEQGGDGGDGGEARRAAGQGVAAELRRSTAGAGGIGRAVPLSRR